MADGKKDYDAITGAISAGISGLRGTGAKETINQFNAMAKAALADGALDTKTKELIALAIGITARCDGCLAFHVKAARKHGATREEIVETIAVALYMGGGPSMIYGAEALSCFDALADG